MVYYILVIYLFIILLRLFCRLVVFRGYNIGVRLIEDFLARSGIGRCNDFRETAEVIAKVSYITIIVL